MTQSTLATQLAEVFAQGRGETAGADTFLPLLTLDSGARCGVDPKGLWIIVPDDGRPPARFDASSAHLFHEVLEQRRPRFEDAIGEAARGLGLPVDDVVWSFPAIEVVRSVLAKQHPYLTRLALEWIGPTELRPLRAEIQAIAQAKAMPLAVRDLAERLVVPG